MKIKLAIYTFLILNFSIIFADNSYGLSVDESCKDVSIVFARGSGAKQKDNDEYKQFVSQIQARLGSTVTTQPYDLGTESYDGAKYPAVDVGNPFNGNAIGAMISGGKANDYGKSVSIGRTELEGYLKKRTQKCPNERIVLGGYSQGAQVIGDVNSRLSSYASKIDFIALFGDPKLYLPEGEGIYPDACRGVNLSKYRRYIGDCHADNGSLGARKPTYLISQFQDKAGLWCNKLDFICGTSKLVYDQAGHERYAVPGGAIDKAAKEIAERLKKTVAPEKAMGIDIEHTQIGVGTTGLDTVFVIDTTGSMGGQINEAKEFARKQAVKIKELNGRVALVAYKDSGDEYTAKIVTGLSEDQDAFQAGLNSLTADGGGDWEEATLHALMTAFNGLAWKDGATKAAVLLTDAPYHSPDRVDGSTLESVTKRSLEIDPVNVYPVVSGGVEQYYTELAEKTSGQVILDDGNTEEALIKALTKIEQRPVALLKNTDYSANPGKEVIFDASDSYVIDATITKYQWDFNGDGIFESETLAPITKYTYSQKFDGTMQVRLSASNGTISNASAVVKIGAYVEPAQPKAPASVTVKVLSTKNGVSTVRLNWKASDSLVDKWAISVNGVGLGLAQGTQKSIEIADIERRGSTEFGVAGITPEGLIGDAGLVTLAKEQETPASTLNWWQLVLDFIRRLFQPFTFSFNSTWW